MNDTVKSIRDPVDPTSAKDAGWLISTIQSAIQAKHEIITECRDDINDLSEELEAAKIEKTRLQRKETLRINQEAGRKWKAENPKEHKAFIEKLRAQHQEAVIEGFLDGLWDLDDDGNMAGPAIVFKLSDFADVNTPLLAHVMARAGVFPSIGQARKSGWDKPLTVGEWCVTKKKIRIKVVNNS